MWEVTDLPYGLHNANEFTCGAPSRRTLQYNEIHIVKLIRKMRKVVNPWRKKSVQSLWMQRPTPSTSYTLTVCRTSCGNRCRSAPVFSCRSALAINGRKRGARLPRGCGRVQAQAHRGGAGRNADSDRRAAETRGVDAGEIVLHLLRLCTRDAARRLVFKRNETYTLAPDADLAALRERDGEAGQVLALFEQPGQTLSVSEIRDRLGKGAGQTLDALAGEGYSFITAIRRRKPAIRPKKCSVWIWKQVKPCRTSAAAVRRG